MDKIAVLISCYNEEKTIAKVIADTQTALPDAVIYVYNNNSTDRTAEIAGSFGDHVIVRNEYMQGKGNVIRRMFREIDAQCYVMVDGDDTYPMESAPEMVDLVLNRNADMVVGDRLSSTYFTENTRRFHNMGNTVVRMFINHIFHCDIKDIMTGFRAFSYDFVKTFPVLLEFSRTGLVDRFPTLIVCCFVFLSAILSLFTGLILSNMERSSRRDFELQRNMIALRK